MAIPMQKVMAHTPKGFVKVDEQELLEFVAREGSFHDRTHELEHDNRFKQIVVYIAVECQGKLLSYQRINSTDKRFERKHSIGFGGHVNTDDRIEGKNPVLMGRTRELNEEVTLIDPQFEFLGTLNILQEPVDEFHLGIVYLARVQTPDYKLNEVDKYLWSGWITPEEAVQKFDKLESWSKAVFEKLYPQLTPAKISG